MNRMASGNIRTTGLILFIAGAAVFAASGSITGAFTGQTAQTTNITFAGAISMLAGVFLFVTGDNLELRIGANKNVNSFRRWLEKREGRKVSHSEAKTLYSEIEKGYFKAAGKGTIRQGETSELLSRLEQYAKQHAVEYGLERVHRNEAADILSKGKSPNQRELIRIAKKSGYEVREGPKHIEVYLRNEGRKLTEIPRHKEINPYTAKSILKDLATGEPSFQKRRKVA